MNYKIKITEDNQAIVKRIANENEMNPHDLLFILFEPFYTIENCIFTGARLTAEDPELTTEKFIEMFDKQQAEWKPKRGERVLVWDMDEEPGEAIFFDYNNGKIVVFDDDCEFDDYNNAAKSLRFIMIKNNHMKQIPAPEAIVETDFKTKVIELVEVLIIGSKFKMEAALKAESYHDVLAWKIANQERKELLNKIKEL